ncbi:hypothetical protein FI667_g9301, partial [Globisporangium splendens]
MTSSDLSATWNPAAVIAQAKELIHSSNYEKVGEARKVVDDTIVQWVQSVQQHLHGASVVIELWRQYAALEIELRQFKQATKVFESAVSCPVAHSSTELWLQYASFCVERKKFSNARKIFVRGLQTVKVEDQDALWQAFHAFVVAHIDPLMSLENLKAQVVPDNLVGSSTATAPATAPTPVAEQIAPPQQQQQQPVQSVSTQQNLAANVQAAHPPVSAPAAYVSANGHAAVPSTSKSIVSAPAATVIKDPPIIVDPALAFIDKTGRMDPVSPSSGTGLQEGSKKRGIVSPDVADIKRVKQENEPPAPSSTQPLDITDTLYFRHIPTSLPFIPGCPHLLFDIVSQGETHQELGEELLERLSDVLSDSAVFQGVKDLCDNQRQRDRETLYRWQDLVGMQMKEGSELFARHVDVEVKHASDPRVLITLKTQHLEQRREFITRCQMSQQQFIEISAMDRMNALKAQQISLENMKIPEMTVSTDPSVIGMQRAILGLILEAEKLWREESNKPAATPVKAVTSDSSARASRGPSFHKQDTSSLNSSRGHFRGNRGGARGGRGGNTMDRHANSRSNASHGSHRSPPRRDHNPYQHARIPAGVPHTNFDPHVPRHQQQQLQQQYPVRGSFQGQQQPHHMPQQFNQQPQRAREHYGDRIVTHTQEFNNFPPQQDMSRNGVGRFAVHPSAAAPEWQQHQRNNVAPHRGNEYNQSSRFGGHPGGGQAASSYATGPPKQKGRSYGGSGSGPAGGNMMAPPPQYGGGYSKFAGAPQQQQRQQRGGPHGHPQQQPPPYTSFDSNDYHAPQSDPSFSNRNPAPYQQQQHHPHHQQQPPPYQQQQHMAPPPFQQQQQRGGRGGGGYGNQHPPMNHMPGYSRGNNNDRRRGGGRYGRR